MNSLVNASPVFFPQQEFIELLHVRYGAEETKMTKIVLVTSFQASRVGRGEVEYTTLYSGLLIVETQ